MYSIFCYGYAGGDCRVGGNGDGGGVGGGGGDGLAVKPGTLTPPDLMLQSQEAMQTGQDVRRPCPGLAMVLCCSHECTQDAQLTSCCRHRSRRRQR